MLDAYGDLCSSCYYTELPGELCVQTPLAPQVWNVTLTCEILSEYTIIYTNENVNDCRGYSRNKRERNRERVECCSNSMAQSAPVHVLFHSNVLVLHKPWCFVLLSCPLQVPRQCPVLQGPAAVPTEQDMPRLLSEQAKALLVPGWWRWSPFTKPGAALGDFEI